MRLPNGYGSITKLSGNRRNPYIVRITAGYDDEGRQIRKILGYYPNRKKALEALAAYSENPYDIDASRMTFAELYSRWSKEKFAKISKSATRMYISAYSYCAPLDEMRITEIRTVHMQEIIDFAEVGAPTRARIQSMLKLMFRFAMKNDFIKKDYAQFLKRPTVEVEAERIPFSDDEIEKMWTLSDSHYAKILLILMYTGWRPSELVSMRFGLDIDMKELTMKGGMKTQAGKNRIVPICAKIEPLVRYFESKGYTGISVGSNGEELDYYKLYHRLKAFLDENEFKHIPYECRHTFATMLDNHNINAKIKKMLMGHASNDVTEKVYTHKTIEQLRSAVNAL